MSKAKEMFENEGYSYFINNKFIIVTMSYPIAIKRMFLHINIVFDLKAKNWYYCREENYYFDPKRYREFLEIHKLHKTLQTAINQQIKELGGDYEYLYYR